MRNFVLIVLLAYMHAGGCDSAALAPARNNEWADVAELIQHLVNDAGLPSVAVALVSQDKIAYERAVGWADRSNNIPTNIHRAYPLASASKPIIASAIMLLAKQKKINLQAVAAEYLPSSMKPPARKATYTFSVAQLLTHTAGLGTYARIYWRDQQNVADSQLLFDGRFIVPIQAPGIVFEYSNLGYGLLGTIIEKQSNTSLHDYLQKNIFSPLAMNDSDLIDGYTKPSNAVTKYDHQGQPLSDSANDTPAAGNVWASVHDLALFASFQLNGDQAVLAADDVQKMRTTFDSTARYDYYDQTPYAFGWYVKKINQQQTFVWHEGGMPGASSIIVLLPEQKLAAVVLINANDRNDEAQQLARALLQIKAPQLTWPALEPAKGFVPYTDDKDFAGEWLGELDMQRTKLPVKLAFLPNNTVQLSFPQHENNNLLATTQGGALIHNNYLLASFRATLPDEQIAQNESGLVSLRLLRRGETMQGAFVAYAGNTRLEHLLPFSVVLKRINNKVNDHGDNDN